ncbi:hypothetical protein Glove_85g97 [Diversispora epigaea]|uniref:TLDc domain-containing protein n=1 Tax=Diversispora epigaea TaxID=1348612 RepID=A0A397JAP9_9GLOM|nr:hypothetical protein Glove_85g97 [Diversispora epigaea]
MDSISKISARNKYKFQLVYRRSRDGYNLKTFYSKVNGQDQAIAIIKIKNSEKIIGGFNASGWNYNNYNHRNKYSGLRGSLRIRRCVHRDRRGLRDRRRLHGAEYEYSDNNQNHFIFSFGENYKIKIGKFVSGNDICNKFMLYFGNGDIKYDGKNATTILTINLY